MATKKKTRAPKRDTFMDRLRERRAKEAAEAAAKLVPPTVTNVETMVHPGGVLVNNHQPEYKQSEAVRRTELNRSVFQDLLSRSMPYAGGSGVVELDKDKLLTLTAQAIEVASCLFVPEEKKA